jgi:hypothetical protein
LDRRSCWIEKEVIRLASTAISSLYRHDMRAMGENCLHPRCPLSCE